MGRRDPERIPTWFGSITEVTTCKVMNSTMLNEFGANLSATGDNDLEAEQIWSSWHDSFRMIRMEERPGNLVSTMYHLTWKQGRSAFGNTDNEDYVKCLQSLECSTRCSDFQARSTDLANRAEVTGRKIDGSGFESQKPMKINDRSLVAILLANPRTCATARFQVRGARQSIKQFLDPSVDICWNRTCEESFKVNAEMQGNCVGWTPAHNSRFQVGCHGRRGHRLVPCSVAVWKRSQYLEYLVG